MSYAHQPDEKSRRDAVLEIQVLFDTGESVRRVNELMRRVCQTASPTFALLQLNEDLMSNCGFEAARRAANANLLVVSMETDFDLPFFAKDWLARWINFRDNKQADAFVALVAEVLVPPDVDSKSAAYLKTVAVVGGLGFFYRCAHNHGREYNIAKVAFSPFTGSRVLECGDRPPERWGINE